MRPWTIVLAIGIALAGPPTVTAQTAKDQAKAKAQAAAKKAAEMAKAKAQALVNQAKTYIQQVQAQCK